MTHFKKTIRTKRSWILLWCLMVPFYTNGQQEIGKINKILDVKSNQLIKNQTEKVRVQHEKNWMKAYPEIEVNLGDQILLQQFTRINLQVNDASRKGNMVLTTTALETNKKDAAFHVGDSITQLGGLQMAVLRGTLLVDWTRGTLTTMANRIRTLFRGTKVLYSIDEEGQNSFLYLQEGRITFPDYPQVTVQPRQKVMLTPGLAPAPVGASLMEQRQFDQFIKINSHFPKAKIWWKKPGIIIPGLAVAGTLIYLVAKGGNKESDHAKGIINIQIP